MHSTAARRWAALIDQVGRWDLTNRQFAEQNGVPVEAYWSRSGGAH